jgi:hypothetical protein
MCFHIAKCTSLRERGLSGDQFRSAIGSSWPGSAGYSSTEATFSMQNPWPPVRDASRTLCRHWRPSAAESLNIKLPQTTGVRFQAMT